MEDKEIKELEKAVEQIWEVVRGLEPRDVVSGVEELAVRIEEHREARGRDNPAERIAYARRFDIAVMAERMRGIYGRLAHGRP